jgi:hypothetical protein
MGHKTFNRSVPQLTNTTVKFKIIKIDTTNVILKRSLRILDTTYAQFSTDTISNPFSPVNIWYAFLPYRDTLSLWIEPDKEDSSIVPKKNEVIDKGYYIIRFDSLITNSGLYFLKASFCDSVFTKKFLWIR